MISGHSGLLISFILSLMYWGVDNPTFVGMHTFLPYCFISSFKFSIYVYFNFVELWMDIGWNECMWCYKVGDCGLSWNWGVMFMSSIYI